MDATTITIDLKALLFVVLILLAIYAIYALFQLVKTLKKTQKVLDDFEVVSSIASARTKQLDKAIDDISNKIKSGQTIFGLFPVIASAVQKIAKTVSQQSAKKTGGVK